MRTWTKSACVVLAWIVLSIIVMAAGMRGSVPPAQANTRTANSTTEVILTRTISVAAAPVTDTSSATRYLVRTGDTLSGIAARFAVRGGWPALYAANRHVIGRDPNAIRPGTILVLPGQRAPVRYTVSPGDTLSGIAARFAVRGGWPALYAANRHVIGGDPDAIHPGMVLTVAWPTGLAPPAPGQAGPGPRRPAPPPSGPAGFRHHPRPAGTAAPPRAGMPAWLRTLLLAVGLLIAAAFLTEPVLVMVRRRQRQAAGRTPRPGPTEAGQPSAPGQLRPNRARIILADYDRLVVTCNQRDGMVYVLRPPGQDPRAILQVARLVLPEEPYGELAEQLGVAAGWRLE
jgi:LysM repeat protein